MTTRMRCMGIRLICLLAVGLWSTAAGAVAEADVAGYPLPQAWQDALERDARLRAAASRIAQARGRVGEAASERWPSVSATGQVGHVYNRNEARRAVVYEGRSLRGTLYLGQPLCTFGRLTGRTARADADLAEAEAEAELAVRRVKFWPTLSVEVQARTSQVSAIDIFNMGSGLTVDMPLYEGGLLRAQVQTARAALATAQWELAAEQERVETEARAQWEMIESLALVVQDFGQAVEEARTAATLIRDKLAAGRATVVDEVDARHSVLRAEHDVLDGRLRLAGARIDLLRLLAALDRDG